MRASRVSRAQDLLRLDRRIIRDFAGIASEVDHPALQPTAWTMGSLGIIVLLTLLYAGYDSIYGRNTKI